MLGILMADLKKKKKLMPKWIVLFLLIAAFQLWSVFECHVRIQHETKVKQGEWLTKHDNGGKKPIQSKGSNSKSQRLLHFSFSPYQTNATFNPHPNKGTAKRAHNDNSEGSTDLGKGVSLRVFRKRVVMDNGLVRVTWSVPEGLMTGISFSNVHNLLEIRNPKSNRGYWDVAWSAPGYKSSTSRLSARSFNIRSRNENQTEISFTSTWNPALRNSSLDTRRTPLNVDIRYVMLRGHAGFYSYAVLERRQGWPAMDIYQIRAVYKLRRDKFHYMAVSDDRQSIMPMPQDRRTGKSLAYEEAVILTNPTNPNLKGEVDDKYQYSCESKDNGLHGWISFNPPMGFWLISASNEYQTGGPLKQDLTSHVGPTSLAMFHSTHYAGIDVAMKFEDGEPWKKVFGPFFVHLNLVSSTQDPRMLWANAKEKMLDEVGKWPYDFPLSSDFPKSHHRGSVFGRLLVHDRYVSKSLMPASSAWVGLAVSGEVGSWQKEAKGYQFWTQADDDGHFAIKGVREGNYSLNAWVPGFIGDYKYEHDIIIAQGGQIKVGDLIFCPPRTGPTLWEIGVPDRSAAEFYVPDPKPTLSNRLLHHRSNKFRQYGLWDRYTDLYPDHDVIYIIGINDYRKDWFYAQVPRRMKMKHRTLQATTWRIIFALKDLIPSMNYTLQIALASATSSELQVWCNRQDPHGQPHFTTKLIGRDNAIARHGIHGLYWLFSVNLPGSMLHEGNNAVFLKQSRAQTPFQGVMYDYIRLEGPSAEPSNNCSKTKVESSFISDV